VHVEGAFLSADSKPSASSESPTGQALSIIYTPSGAFDLEESGLGGAIIPILSLSVPSIDAYAGYPLLAAAGGLQLFDQFFGTSESWGRYMLAATTLGKLQAELSLKFAHATRFGESELAKYAIVEEYDSRTWAILTTETRNWEALHAALTKTTRNHFTSNDNLEPGINHIAGQD
jgi:hypothetical protein